MALADPPVGRLCWSCTLHHWGWQTHGAVGSRWATLAMGSAPTRGFLCPESPCAVCKVPGHWPCTLRHHPHHSLPFVFGGDASRGCSCISYTHWEDVGFSWLRNAAARSSAGWASDSAAGNGRGTVQTGSPLLVRPAAPATVSLQTLILLFPTLLLILPHRRWRRSSHQQEIA